MNEVWSPDSACTCERCNAYYSDPDEFWDGTDAVRLQSLPSHVDGGDGL